MQANLIFNYPEDELDLRRALNGSKAISGLLDINEQLRFKIKYSSLNRESEEVLMEVRESIIELLIDCQEDM